MQINSAIKYRINSKDEIVFLSSSWDRFAEENDAPELIAENVLNRSLWDFITDETTRQLYNDMLNLARTGKVMRFNFNCDSPGEVRLWEMVVSPTEKDGLQFQTRCLSARNRPSQRLLSKFTLQTNQVIVICGWCKVIDTGGNKWENLEDGISNMGLFERHELPQLSHGMCNACYSVMSEKISKERAT